MVLSGEVEVLRKVGSHEQIMGRFAEGEFLGEVAVLDEGPRSACARAHGPVTVGKIPKDLLLKALLEESPSVSLHLFQQLLSYLRRTNDLFVGEMLNRVFRNTLVRLPCVIEPEREELPLVDHARPDFGLDVDSDLSGLFSQP